MTLSDRLAILRFDDMRTRKRSRLGAAAAVSIAMTASVLAVGVPGSPDRAANAASNDIIAIVLEGTGNGHGRGLSQWGAYGYAVDQDWDWQQILDHYYGGTEASTVPDGQRIRVRLTDADGAATVGVVSYGSPIEWNDETSAAMYAQETSPGVFEVYGSSSRSCPGASTLVVPSGDPEIATESDDSAAVTQVQAFLQAYQSTAVVVDGDFGNQTRGYLLDWQNAQGLTLDGIWNPEDAAKATTIIAADSGDGFTLLGTETTSADEPALSFTIANGDDSSIAPEEAIGLCASNRTVTHYRGSIDVLSTASGNRVVNDVEVEDYLRGVLPKEISALWAEAGDGDGANAVRAQAVAARSYGLQQLRDYFYEESSTRYASTCDTTACQVYGGAARRSTATGSATPVEHPLTDAAAEATASVVRRWPSGHSKSGELVSTEFSASNGPRTAGGEFPPVDDIGDDTEPNPNHRWTRVIDADTLESRYDLGQITSASMIEAAESQYKVYDGIWFNDLVLTGTSGSQRTQAWDFRRSFDLPSPGFTVRVIKEDTTNRSFALIGDSVAESITASGTSEFDRLIDGTFASATISTRVSRCTVRGSCPGTSGVEQAALLPEGLDLVVVELGYNDSTDTFAADIDAMMTALTDRGVRRVAWVNMADIRTTSRGSRFGPMNAQLDAAEADWSLLKVLDWNEASSGAEARARWFDDDVHLSTTGQAQFALWLRAEVLDLAPSHYLVPPKRIRIPVVGQTHTTPAGAEVSLPTSASAVAINITTVDPAAPGFVTVWPCETDRKETSNLNNMGGDIVANNVVASIDSAGEICLYSNVGTDLIVDVAGWFDREAAGDALVSVTPQRIVDSRNGLGSATRALRPEAPLVLDIAGMNATTANGIKVSAPERVSSVVLNITSTNAAAAGYFTVWPCALDREETSSLNYAPGRISANGIVAPVDVNGQVCVYSHVPSDIIVDVQGWFGPTDPVFTATDPNRIVDTRKGLGAPRQQVTPSEPLVVPVRGASLSAAGADVRVPASAQAAIVNVIAVDTTGDGFVTVWPCDGDPPLASNINYRTNEVIANGVVAPIGTDGSICIYTHVPSDIVVDIGGWMSDGFVGVTPSRVLDTRDAVGPAPE